MWHNEASKHCTYKIPLGLMDGWIDREIGFVCSIQIQPRVKLHGSIFCCNVSNVNSLFRLFPDVRSVRIFLWQSWNPTLSFLERIFQRCFTEPWSRIKMRWTSWLSLAPHLKCDQLPSSQVRLIQICVISAPMNGMFLLCLHLTKSHYMPSDSSRFHPSWSASGSDQQGTTSSPKLWCGVTWGLRWYYQRALSSSGWRLWTALLQQSKTQWNHRETPSVTRTTTKRGLLCFQRSGSGRAEAA